MCSATVNAEELKLFFDNVVKEGANNNNNPEELKAVIISVEGRYYPIEISYLKKPCDDYLKASINTALDIHVKNGEGDGDILIFLSGQDEVDVVVSGLIEKVRELKSMDKKVNLEKLLNQGILFLFVLVF